MEKYVVAQNKMDVQANYDALAEHYIQNYSHPKSLFALEKQRRLSVLQDHLCTVRPQSILDLGCGPGYVAAQVATTLSDSVVTGVDFSSGMIEVANRNYSKQALFLQGDVENLPFECKHFSAVFALGLLEKFKNPLCTLNECYRVLIPDGHLYFTYPNRFSFFRVFRRWATAFFGENTGVYDNNILSIEGMQSVVNQIGFKVLEITFLTYGNSFILFPWSEKINLIMEQHFGKNDFGRALSITSFWSVQKT